MLNRRLYNQCFRSFWKRAFDNLHGWAVNGLLSLETNIDKQLKYLDFIDIYTALDDNEMEKYQQQYPQESNTMASLSERLRAEGKHQGMEATLRKQINLKYGSLPEWADERIAAATDEQLDHWISQILSAETLEDLIMH